MKISLFTPTHNTTHLLDAYNSILTQRYEGPWEWILVPNADAHVPEVIRANAHVRVLPLNSQPKGIGELKRFACDAATGDLFVELDHDDLLVPGILNKLADQANKGAGFIYSDEALFTTTDTDHVSCSFNPDLGWETYNFKLYGRTLTAIRNFPITARSLCEVYYAPDHVRAWTREAYYKAGGHAHSLVVGDDHDLICRTYIAGVPFASTHSVGYLYRFHDNNTVKAYSVEIAEQQDATRKKYLGRLITEWCRREGLSVLHLNEYCPVGQSISLPIPHHKRRGSIGLILLSGNLLQFVPQKDLLHFFQHCYDMLAPGGWLCYTVLSADCPAAYFPGACSFHSACTARYISDRTWAEQIGPIGPRFQLVEQHVVEHDMYRTYVNAFLCCIKGQRQPGRVLI
jgi:glycosyltransferase involved in cell wall biosynthesis